MDYIEHEEIICEASPELIKVLSEDKKDLAYIENKISKKIILTPKNRYSNGEYNILTPSY
jgi:hypothetical protein